MRIPILTAWMIALTAAVPAATQEASPRRAPLIAVPGELSLGRAAAGASVRASVWLVNAGDEEIVVEGARAGCGCTTLPGFEPTAIAPSRAAAFALEVSSPERAGKRRKTAVVFTTSAGVVRVPLRLQAVDDAFLEQDPSPTVEERRSASPLRVLSPPSTLRGACGETVEGSVWVVNDSPGRVSIAAAKPSCGCLTLHGEAPSGLEAGEAYELALQVKLPEKETARTERLRLLLEADAPLEIPVPVEALHPWIARLEDLEQTRERGEPTTPFYAPDSRVWFGERAGPGEPRSEEGKGPWSEWDRVMAQVSEVTERRAEGDRVTVILKETNDYFRLLERDPTHVQLTYWFDEEGRIEATLVSAAPGAQQQTEPARDRFPEFHEWARANRPDEIAFLYPDEKIVPGGERAERWRVLLQEWRAAAGLPTL